MSFLITNCLYKVVLSKDMYVQLSARKSFGEKCLKIAIAVAVLKSQEQICKQLDFSSAYSISERNLTFV